MKWTVAGVLAQLRATDENERVEAKSGLGDAAMKTVSSFSNEVGLRGGWIVFGVRRDEDGHYRVTGVKDADALQSDFAAQCRTTLNRAITPEVKVDRVEGERLVVAYVPEARPEDKPVYVKKAGLPKGAFRRIGSTDVRATDADLDRLRSLGQRTPADLRTAPRATLDDLDPAALALFRRSLSEARPGSDLLELDDDGLLQALGAVTVEHGQPTPTVAGLLFFGKRLSLRRVYPMMFVDVLIARGAELGDDYDAVEVREPLVSGWRKIFRAATEHLPRRVQIVEGSMQRRETPRVPDRVVREAIVNALMHRDLEVNASIQVRCYSDRIEFANPGFSLVDEAELGQPKSIPRNPTLAGMFRDLDLAETRGTGLARMGDRLRAAGLPPPEFTNNRAGNDFRLTLRLHHLLDEADWDWLGRFEGLDDVDRQALVFAESRGEIRNEDVRAFSLDTVLEASARLRRLRDRGLLDQQGLSKQDTRYTLAAEAKPVDVDGLSTYLDGQPMDLGGLSTDLGGLSPNLDGLSPNLGGLSPNLEVERLDLDALPAELRTRLDALPQRAPRRALEALVLEICRGRWCEPRDVGRALDRNPSYVLKTLLKPLLEAGRLARRYPDRKHHPRQAYRTVEE